MKEFSWCPGTVWQVHRSRTWETGVGQVGNWTVCLSLCSSVRLSAGLSVCLSACLSTYVRTYVRTYVCMYVCMYACMHVCMYVCYNVCMCVCMYSLSLSRSPSLSLFPVWKRAATSQDKSLAFSGTKRTVITHTCIGSEKQFTVAPVNPTCTRGILPL